MIRFCTNYLKIGSWCNELVCTYNVAYNIVNKKYRRAQ